MTSAIEVVNAALSRAGANPIEAVLAASTVTSIAGDLSAEQIVSGFNYQPTVERCFTSSLWTFARQSIELVWDEDALDAAIPPGWDYIFDLPESMDPPLIRVIALHGPDDNEPIDFDRFGDRFAVRASSGDEIWMLYIGRMPEAVWTADFTNLVIDELTPIFRMALADDPRSAGMFMEVAEARSPRARARDSQGQTPRRVKASGFRRAKAI